MIDFKASLCNNSNFTLNLFNLKVLKSLICSLSFKLQTHCEETTATILIFSTNTFNLSESLCFTKDFYTTFFHFHSLLTSQVIQSIASL